MYEEMCVCFSYSAVVLIPFINSKHLRIRELLNWVLSAKGKEGLMSAVASVDQEFTEAPGAGAWWRRDGRPIS